MSRLAAALLIPAIFAAAPAIAQPGPAAARDALLAADSAFSAAAATQDPVAGISAMFAPDIAVIMRQGLVEGREAVVAAMHANPSYQGVHARWRPIGGTVSADGSQGFTIGYLEVEGAANPERAGRRYLAYWVRRPEGWRVVAYRQMIRPPGEAADGRYEAGLPARSAGAAPGQAEAHARSLAAAEQAFSDRAQQAGLRAAFTEFGRADAIHLVGERGFAVGLEAITGSMPAEGPTPLHWSSDRVIVAPSGDLGLSIGRLYPNGAPPEGQPASLPFFTIWRRDAPDQPWRYIAE